MERTTSLRRFQNTTQPTKRCIPLPPASPESRRSWLFASIPSCELPRSDTTRYPESLDELVEKRYLRALPMDPVLDSDKAWRIVAPAADKKGQVADLHSAAPGQTLDGKAFDEL